jgi:hypothetical protein
MEANHDRLTVTKICSWAAHRDTPRHTKTHRPSYRLTLTYDLNAERLGREILSCLCWRGPSEMFLEISFRTTTACCAQQREERSSWCLIAVGADDVVLWYYPAGHMSTRHSPIVPEKDHQNCTEHCPFQAGIRTQGFALFRDLPFWKQSKANSDECAGPACNHGNARTAVPVQ